MLMNREQLDDLIATLPEGIWQIYGRHEFSFSQDISLELLQQIGSAEHNAILQYMKFMLAHKYQLSLEKYLLTLYCLDKTEEIKTLIVTADERSNIYVSSNS